MHSRLSQILAYWLSKLTKSSPDQFTSNRSNSEPTSRSDSDPIIPAAEIACHDLQREIRAERKFSLAEAIGREGGSFMKGESAIPRPLRARTELDRFITAYLHEPTGALATTLYTWASDDIRVSRQLDTPLVALAQILESLLAEPTTFSEFARRVAIAHSRLTGDRPHFQQFGQPAPADVEHTHQSITLALTALHDRLLDQLNDS